MSIKVQESYRTPNRLRPEERFISVRDYQNTKCAEQLEDGRDKKD